MSSVSTTIFNRNSTTTTSPSVTSAPPLQKHSQPRGAKLYHSLSILISNVAYLYIAVIALFRISDHPIARYPFAAIFLTQEDNPCRYYGILELLMVVCIIYTHFYIIFEQMTLRFDHPILVKRRKLIKMLFFAFNALLGLLLLNFLYCLHQIGTPLSDLYTIPQFVDSPQGTDFYYYHYFYTFVCFVVSLIVITIGNVCFPLKLPPMYVKSSQSVKKSISSTKNIKSTRSTAPVPSTMHHTDVLAELNIKYPENGTISIFDDQIPPPSGDTLQHCDSESDYDEDDFDEDDESQMMDRVDELIDNMIQKIELMKEGVSAKNTHDNSDDFITDTNNRFSDKKTLDNAEKNQGNKNLEGTCDENGNTLKKRK